jgi:3-deoxy-D-manno-octulosonic-acid transferase
VTVLRLLYTLLLYLLSPVVLLRLAWRGLRAPAYLRRWPERFGFIEPPLGERVIWIHAVSVGEVQAAEPLVRALLERFAEYSILLTTVTPTGSARVTELFGDEVAHVYAPYDLPDAVARFFDRVRPRLAVIMETELWPNLFHACHARQIPLLLVNARLSQRSLIGYRRVHRLVRSVLGRITRIAAQGEADAARFIELGAQPRQVTVTGNLKFEQRIAPSLLERAAALRRDWGSARPVWIAASTHEGEDALVLDVFGQLRNSLPDCLLVIVPRHPERFAAVAELCRRRGFQVRLRSEHQPCSEAIQVFVGDSMGELPLFYAASDVAFVGGSLVRHGGHNLLEPAALGVPVVTGPHVFNFTEIMRLLSVAGACRKVESVAGLERVVREWLQDANARHAAGERGREVIGKNRGALAAVLGMIESQLGDR